MTLNQSAMIIDFDAYLEICEEEVKKMSNAEIFAKFSSNESYDEYIDATGISINEFSFSDYIKVFNEVKPFLDKSLADFRNYWNNNYDKDQKTKI